MARGRTPREVLAEHFLKIRYGGLWLDPGDSSGRVTMSFYREFPEFRRKEWPKARSEADALLAVRPPRFAESAVKQSVVDVKPPPPAEALQEAARGVKPPPPPQLDARALSNEGRRLLHQGLSSAPAPPHQKKKKAMKVHNESEAAAARAAGYEPVF